MALKDLSWDPSSVTKPSVLGRTVTLEMLLRVRALLPACNMMQQGTKHTPMGRRRIL